VLQFGRGDNVKPDPVVQLARVPQHSILKLQDRHLEGTTNRYDLNVINSNIDFE
jgi:hypothetical protein